MAASSVWARRLGSAPTRSARGPMGLAELTTYKWLGEAPASPAPNAGRRPTKAIRDQLPWMACSPATNGVPVDVSTGRKFRPRPESIGRVLRRFITQPIYFTGTAWRASNRRGLPNGWNKANPTASFSGSVIRHSRPLAPCHSSGYFVTENGWHITELDSVPGGIGLTDWLNATYPNALGGCSGMTEGFAGIFAKPAQCI